MRLWPAVFVAVLFLSPLALHAETPLERGAYLVNSIMACGNCHTPMGPNGPLPGMDLAGGNVFEEKPFTARAPNITQDRETGIGSWTDAQIARAIREGIRPDGTLIGPPMPIELYRQVSDTDLAATVAYLRTVKPVANKIAKSEYRMPLPPAYGPPVVSVPDVPRGDKVKYGAYLAGPLGHCIECHTPMSGPGQRDFANSTGAGGFELRGPWGLAITANITPHRDTGIGKWSDAQVKRAITQAIRADGTPLNPPMGYAYYARMTTADLDALVAYLRSLKPVKNAVR
jgi:mono/diheme cytochrome c family protein